VPARIARHFHVHLGHQRTGRVEDLQRARSASIWMARETPCALKITVALSGTSLSFLDEHRAMVRRPIHHVLVVDHSWRT